MAKKKVKSKRPAKGEFIRAVSKEYNHCWYEGVVTESFDDLIQIYGTGHREPLGFHELNVDEHSFIKVERNRVVFGVDQELRAIESNKLRAEARVKDLVADLLEHQEHKATYFGEFA